MYTISENNNIIIRSELCLDQPPSEELLEWARIHIKENPDTKYQILSELRDLIYARGEVIPYRTDDEFLLRFLRARHFHLERSYDLVVSYCNFRDKNYEKFYKNVDLDLIERHGKWDIVVVPPYHDQNGRRIMNYRFGNWDPAKVPLNDLLAGSIMLLEMAICEPQLQIMGGLAIFDLSDISMNQFLHMSPGLVETLSEIMLTAFPIRIEALHVVNQSWVLDTAFTLFKPFLNDFRKQRIFFHGDDMNSLHKHIDPNHLPQKYGGVHPDFDYMDWIKGFRRNKAILSELKKLGYDQSE